MFSLIDPMTGRFTAPVSTRLDVGFNVERSFVFAPDEISDDERELPVFNQDSGAMRKHCDAHKVRLMDRAEYADRYWVDRWYAIEIPARTPAEWLLVCENTLEIVTADPLLVTLVAAWDAAWSGFPFALTIAGVTFTLPVDRREGWFISAVNGIDLPVMVRDADSAKRLEMALPEWAHFWLDDSYVELFRPRAALAERSTATL